jgi:predicted AAA+ superfamily ATPase
VALSLDALRPWNAHWLGGGVSPLVLRHPNERAAVRFLVGNIRDPPAGQWEVLAGPRQIGKTTSLGHVARHLLQDGAPPRSVAIVPLDQPGIQGSLEGGLDELVRVLSTAHPPREDAPLYLLLDEVQELPRWSQALKAAWDRHHAAVRVLATGSSALKMIRPVEADFPGRIRVETIHPMKFREVLAGHPDAARHAPAEAWAAIEEAAKAARGALTTSDEAFWERLLALHERVHGASRTLPSFLQASFVEYAVRGGYPAARPGTDRPEGRRDVFEQAWNAVLGKDLTALGIVKTREFSQLFHEIAVHPGMKFVASNVARRLDVRADTVREWKRVLEDALLVQQLPPLKPNLNGAGGKDKAYLTDPGWFAHFRGILEPASVHDADLGLLVETVLVDHARRLQFGVTRSATLPKGYVDDPEADIAVSLGSKWLVLESKFRGKADDHLAEVGRRGDVRVCATRDHFEVDEARGVCYVPAAEWALVC